MAEILVCDDDKEIVEAIEIYLTQEGHHILKAYDGEQAIRVLQNHPVDLLIIDVMMPKLDGIRATLKIREKNALPIIILSAKSEDADKILGLNVGADDYVTKPFNPLELVARVKSQLRRYTQLGAMTEKKENIYETGGLMIDDDRKEVKSLRFRHRSGCPIVCLLSGLLAIAGRQPEGSDCLCCRVYGHCTVLGYPNHQLPADEQPLADFPGLFPHAGECKRSDQEGYRCSCG